MVFSSIPFLFFFLPLCLILYYAVPFSLKNGILLLFSLIFYAWGEPVYILLMLSAAAVDYVNGRLMERYGTTVNKRRCFLCCSVFINLSVLAFFKYADFVIYTINSLSGLELKPLKLGLPVGISFFTFQTMSYIIDLYRREVPAEKNYLTYLTYVSMFPQLVAGPIVRFAAVNEELHHRKLLSVEVRDGLLRFMRGLFKKVLLANQAGALCREILLLDSAEVSVAAIWLGMTAFTIQLYFDFSAYSDMAIGMGWMLGFHFSENFFYPLSAVSVTDFWRRWHISLSTWFRDYIYIPLGGNRKGVWKHLRNMLIVWFLTGLWHGASWNFVLWGCYYGVLLALEKYVWGRGLSKLPRLLQHVYTLMIVIVGFTIFYFEDMGAMERCFASMLGLAGNPLWKNEVWWYIRNYGAVLLPAAVLSFPCYPWLKEHLSEKQKALVSVLGVFAYVGLFLLSAACLVHDTYNPFLYFRF